MSSLLFFTLLACDENSPPDVGESDDDEAESSIPRDNNDNNDNNDDDDIESDETIRETPANISVPNEQSETPADDSDNTIDTEMPTAPAPADDTPENDNEIPPPPTPQEWRALVTNICQHRIACLNELSCPTSTIPGVDDCIEDMGQYLSSVEWEQAFVFSQQWLESCELTQRNMCDHYNEGGIGLFRNLACECPNTPNEPLEECPGDTFCQASLGDDEVGICLQRQESIPAEATACTTQSECERNEICLGHCLRICEGIESLPSAGPCPDSQVCLDQDENGNGYCYLDEDRGLPEDDYIWDYSDCPEGRFRAVPDSRREYWYLYPCLFPCSE